MSANKRNRNKKISEEKGIAILKDRLLAKGMQLDSEPIKTCDGERKLSGILLDLLEPYKKFAPTKADFEMLIDLGILAWNASILGIEKGAKLVNDYFLYTESDVGFHTNQEVKKLVLALITDKERLYPNDKRLILDKLIQYGKNGDINLTVSYPDTNSK